ncbi:hypothetical protein ROZALSC1DRAFT_26110 [Rozella allomycis CSF55]|uniref:C-type lectin domain-containing protein n=1 Tax=Rozella allomycis (strain CSF55) TaxID=988480 RepID=A0A4P9Y9F6_ROZAC|nr:hypothetical protein ROZALSC1DRAFT_26110 [Rozella allomycis CSF55]
MHLLFSVPILTQNCPELSINIPHVSTRLSDDNYASPCFYIFHGPLSFQEAENMCASATDTGLKLQLMRASLLSYNPSEFNRFLSSLNNTYNIRQFWMGHGCSKGQFF